MTITWEDKLRDDQNQITLPVGKNGFIEIHNGRSGTIMEIHSITQQLSNGTAKMGASITKGGVNVCASSVFNTSMGAAAGATSLSAYGPPYEYLEPGESLFCYVWGASATGFYTVRWSFRLGVTY